MVRTGKVYFTYYASPAKKVGTLSPVLTRRGEFGEETKKKHYSCSQRIDVVSFGGKRFTDHRRPKDGGSGTEGERRGEGRRRGWGKGEGNRKPQLQGKPVFLTKNIWRT